MSRTLVQAAGKCDVDLLMRALAGEFGPVEKKELNEATIRAAGVGYADIVTCLLARGADPDAEDSYGETPVIHAAAGNHVRALRMILNAGADVNWVNDSGRSALHLAVKNNCPASVLLLLRSGGEIETDQQDDEGETPLILAASAGDALMLQMIIQAKANVNLQTLERSTALHQAVSSGSKMCVMLLLEAKAEVNVIDIRGNTPLLIACQNGEDDIGYMIMEQGADIYAKDRQGKLPLDYAMEKGLASMAEFLFAAGALDKKESNNLAPIMKALTTGNRPYLKALLGANYNTNLTGEVTIGQQQLTCTPLEAALRLGHIDMASLLVMGGSDLDPILKWARNRESAPAEVRNSENTMAWLMIMPKRAAGLRSLSRIAIRKHLGFCPGDDVKTLFKLRALQQYVLFQKN